MIYDYDDADWWFQLDQEVSNWDDLSVPGEEMGAEGLLEAFLDQLAATRRYPVTDNVAATVAWYGLFLERLLEESINNKVYLKGQVESALPEDWSCWQQCASYYQSGKPLH